jgi:hypothetical protein
MAQRTWTYTIWVGMIDRCHHPNSKDYHRYGELGVKVCDEWRNDYVKFKEWAYGRLEVPKMSIERIDPNGDYEPSNCIVIPHWAQAYNRRNSALNLVQYVQLALDLENTPGYRGKSRDMAKKYGVERYVVTHVNHPSNRRRLIDLHIQNPKWYQDVKRSFNGTK